MSSESAANADFTHVPVMLNEVVDWFRPIPDGVIVDATLGGAGHSTAILQALPNMLLLGLDRDLTAIHVAQTRLKQFGRRACVRHCRYDHIAEAVSDVCQPSGESEASGSTSPRTEVEPKLFAGASVTGVLFDLGVSSPQLDRAERGFSFRLDAELDMRMDTSVGMTAKDVVNTYAHGELARVLSAYGDEKFASRIAKAIIGARPISTTGQLAAVVVEAIPAATRRTGGHPAKRTFQALRIEVNDELRVLERAISAAIDLLAPGGRCVVLAYHSGEDRIVKACFREAETGGCSCPPGLPCVCGALPRGRMVRRGVQRPHAAEIAANPRAASAVARVFEKAGSGGSAPVGAGSLTPRIRSFRS